MTEIAMTWGEFKAAVKAAGVEDHEKLAWIDWSGPYAFVAVERYPNGDVKITEDSEKITEDLIEVRNIAAGAGRQSAHMEIADA